MIGTNEDAGGRAVTHRENTLIAACIWVIFISALVVLGVFGIHLPIVG